MTPDQLALLATGILVIAFLYSSVGHAGASGYIAVMSLLSVAPDVIKPTALTLNILVASIGSVAILAGRTFLVAALLAVCVAGRPTGVCWRLSQPAGPGVQGAGGDHPALFRGPLPAASAAGAGSKRTAASRCDRIGRRHRISCRSHRHRRGNIPHAAAAARAMGEGQDRRGGFRAVHPVQFRRRAARQHRQHAAGFRRSRSSWSPPRRSAARSAPTSGAGASIRP